MYHKCTIYLLKEGKVASDEPFGSLHNIEDYAEMANSPVHYLILESLGRPHLLVFYNVFIWFSLEICSLLMYCQKGIRLF